MDPISRAPDDLGLTKSEASRVVFILKGESRRVLRRMDRTTKGIDHQILSESYAGLSTIRKKLLRYIENRGQNGER